jgi:hypothetical protein
MENCVTPLKKKAPKKIAPRKFVIENILNYSRSLSIINFSGRDPMFFINN